MKGKAKPTATLGATGRFQNDFSRISGLSSGHHQHHEYPKKHEKTGNSNFKQLTFIHLERVTWVWDAYRKFTVNSQCRGRGS
jgi:hypothetical protein